MEDSISSWEENVEQFLLNLYREVSTEKRWSDELPDIVNATKEMVNRIVDEATLPYLDIYKSEGITSIIVSEAGSMADGTSICDPDEFDFTLAFSYSSDIYATTTSSNSREISLSKCVVKLKDPMFRQVFIRDELVLPPVFVRQHFQRLEKAIVKVSEGEPVRRGEKCLYLCVSDGEEHYYGMQGPSFHLHNLMKWCSPNRKTDFFISIDLVPAIQFNDENVCASLPHFRQECSCEEHVLALPDHGLLLPMKSRELAYSTFLHNSGEGDNVYWRAKRDFLESNFMVSFTGYENDLLKQWKCEKSIYHNWYICYSLMKCFGKLDHNCGSTVKYQAEGLELQYHKETTFPERNDSFSSYSWKNIVFTQAQKEGSKCVTLKNCFDCLTSAFEEENLQKSKVLSIDSFWCPSEIAETVHLTMEDGKEYTPYVKSMISLKLLLNQINTDESYAYEKYKEKLLDLFPELSPHLVEVKS